MPFALVSQRVVLPDGVRPAAVLVEGETIAAIVSLDELPRGATVLDVGSKVVMPGLVDTHVHVNEPGRTEWEGFETATKAAAAGGITTLFDMPLNSTPVTTTLEALKRKLEAAQGQLWVDVGFWGGVVPGNQAELGPLIGAGVAGFKAFLTHSGIDDFPNATEADLRRAMPLLASHHVPLLAHAELDGPAEVEEEADPRRYATFLASRPPSWEVSAIELMIKLCRETECPVHIVHLSAAEALPLVAKAKAEGLPFSVETCPHYLVFSAEEIPDGATEFKCTPPIRDSANRDALWQGLRDGLIDFVACDHSPCTPGLKLPETGDFMKAWGGISSLQFSLPIIWTHAQERGLGLMDLTRWLSQRTANFAGYAHKKGRIAPGCDADLVVWDPEASFDIRSSMILHRHLQTPYAGRSLRGTVEKTYLRGSLIYDRGALSDAPSGQFLIQPLRSSYRGKALHD